MLTQNLQNIMENVKKKKKSWITRCFVLHQNKLLVLFSMNFWKNPHGFVAHRPTHFDECCRGLWMQWHVCIPTMTLNVFGTLSLMNGIAGAGVGPGGWGACTNRSTCSVPAWWLANALATVPSGLSRGFLPPCEVWIEFPETGLGLWLLQAFEERIGAEREPCLWFSSKWF